MNTIYDRADAARDFLANLYKGNVGRQRCISVLLSQFRERFGVEAEGVLSAPGRTEIGGNHTDHQHGCVLAASIDCDVICAVRPRDDGIIRLYSQGYGMMEAEVPRDGNIGSPGPGATATLKPGTTEALMVGVAAGFLQRGHKAGGFDAYLISDVLSGSGMSSSAAFEVAMGEIQNHFYNEGRVSPEEIARIGQIAERDYFGKPCGLMDQMACSVGGLCFMDFLDPEKPLIRKILFDPEVHGYRLCIVDTGGSHADLTEDYAAVPMEMGQVAKHLGRSYLRGVTRAQLLAEGPVIRETCGDRAFLRALHFVEENARVIQMAEALEQDDFRAFLRLVKASGDSSFRFLQNVYSNRLPRRQEMAVALALAETVLGEDGVCRVHGGGFAGTIQAYVRPEAMPRFRETMEQALGAGVVTERRIRPQGGIRII